jgi:hypothetical protein
MSWTKRDLETATDETMLILLLGEKMSRTKVGSPIHQRFEKIRVKLKKRMFKRGCRSLGTP